MADIDDLCGRTLGGFVLRERLDQGGFGTVYRADQPLLGRPVGVKVLRRRARRNDVSVQRFAREALLSSQLDHPYAAHVYAFGIEDDGLVWIAMELVQGTTLSRWLGERGRVPLDQFVPFFERLAEVVYAAHQHGIIHRDLKPSNVMVIERAGQLLPKLLDFGVAKLLDGVTLPHLAATEALVVLDETPRELAAAAGTDGVATVRLRRSVTPNRRAGHPLTRASLVVGSPPYMAPEQWESGVEVAPAMDLYALGVLAYEALTGRLPFHADTAVEYAALHRAANVPSLGDDLVALDATFKRALAKHPQDRFRSALELAASLRLELEARMVAQIRASARHWHDRGRPRGLLWGDDALAELERWMARTGAGLTPLELAFVDACRAQEAQRQEASRRHRRWIRRGALAVAIATLAGIVVGMQCRASSRTEEAEQRAQLTKHFAEQARRQAEIEQGRAALLHGEFAEARPHLADAYYGGERSVSTEFMFARALHATLAERARFDARSGRMWSSAFSPSGAQLVTTDDARAEIWDIATKARIATLPHTGSVYQALYSANGARLYTACADATVKVWNAKDGMLVTTLVTPHREGRPMRYMSMALSSDGRTLAAITSAGDRVQVWNAESGAPIATLQLHGAGFPSIAFVGDGTWLVAGGGEDVTVFSTRSWGATAVIRGPRIHTMAVNARRDWIATGTVGGDVAVWDVRSGHRVRHLREVGEAVDRVAFSPDGELLAIASRDATEQVWQASTGTLHSTGVRLQGSTIALEFDASSRFALAAGSAGTVVVADVALGMPVDTFDGATGAIYSAHFSPTSREIVAASWDGTARIWNASSSYMSWATPPVSEDCGLFGGADPDGRFIAVGCRDLPTRVWDTSSHQLTAELPSVVPVDGDYSSAYPVVSSDGAQAAIARGSEVALFGIPGGGLLHAVAHHAAVNTVAFRASTHDLVSGSIDGTILLTRDGQQPVPLPHVADGVDVVGFLPDGKVVASDALRRLAIYSADGSAKLADTALDARARALRVSADGRRLATLPRRTAPTGVPELWDLEHYRRLGYLSGHVGGVYAVRFLPDALFTAGADGSVRMWDIETGRLMRTYHAGSHIMTDATLDPDGNFVVAGSGDGSIHFWDRATGRLLWQLSAHRSQVAALHFEAGDLVTRGFGGDISRWSLSPPRQVIEEYERRSGSPSTSGDRLPCGNEEAAPAQARGEARDPACP